MLGNIWQSVGAAIVSAMQVGVNCACAVREALFESASSQAVARAECKSHE
jgi:hypothetical protein